MALVGAACRAVPDITFEDSPDAGSAEGGGAPASPDASTAAIRRIRCGVPASAPPYEDSNGQVWGGDVDFDVGSVVGNDDPIQGTSDPALYHSERYADRVTFPSGFRYTFDGIASGPYVVRLHFVEATSAPIVAAGQRRFNVLANGAAVLTELDIFAEAGGRDRALVKTFPVTVSGSSLVLQFTPGSAQNPKVNAIEVVKAP